MPVSLVFIDGLDKDGAGRFKSSATGAFVVTLPFGMEVSEVLPSCEYVDADDADALEGGTVVRAYFFGLEGVDMTRIGGAATVQRKRGCAETSSLAAWGKGPLEANIDVACGLRVMCKGGFATRWERRIRKSVLEGYL